MAMPGNLASLLGGFLGRTPSAAPMAPMPMRPMMGTQIAGMGGGMMGGGLTKPFTGPLANSAGPALPSQAKAYGARRRFAP